MSYHPGQLQDIKLLGQARDRFMPRIVEVEVLDHRPSFTLPEQRINLLGSEPEHELSIPHFIHLVEDAECLGRQRHIPLCTVFCFQQPNVTPLEIHPVTREARYLAGTHGCFLGE
ncbi:hypothetical protein SAMN05216404_108139 [Nitrosospira multiformis]|uniref:Uncharacterized protein n=1 Tax=Nitrosospira multiformis TaxID=1231 RepID=A0A1H8KGS6_9PROT|nr:hypothetical protein SAMN05216404_108139 [Nitrosospira multiformis]